MQHTFTFPLPPTLNDQIKSARSGWRVSARIKKNWTNKITLACRNSPRFEGKVWLEFRWQVRSFARDADNIAASSKFILDGLVQAKVLKEDNLMIIQSPVIHWYERGKVDKVILTISSELFALSQNIAKPSNS